MCTIYSAATTTINDNIIEEHSAESFGKCRNAISRRVHIDKRKQQTYISIRFEFEFLQSVHTQNYNLAAVELADCFSAHRCMGKVALETNRIKILRNFLFCTIISGFYVNSFLFIGFVFVRLISTPIRTDVM